MSDKLQEGLALFRQEYYGDIREMAKDYRQDIIDGEITSWDELDQRIHEDVDSSQWIIYTFKAQCVLIASDNCDAGPDELGKDCCDFGGPMMWSQLAYWAMRQDLVEQLDAEGIDQDTLEKIEEYNDTVGEDATKDDRERIIDGEDVL